jgi:hypothetical protein
MVFGGEVDSKVTVRKYYGTLGQVAQAPLPDQVTSESKRYRARQSYLSQQLTSWGNIFPIQCAKDDVGSEQGRDARGVTRRVCPLLPCSPSLFLWGTIIGEMIKRTFLIGFFRTDSIGAIPVTLFIAVQQCRVDMPLAPP